MHSYRPYAPLNHLKPVADDIWTVDGPEIALRYLAIKLPFPTRMTVVRLPSGDLWIHSPIAWDAALGTTIDALGPVRHLVAPNTLHYWYLPDWQAHYPDATSYAAPDLDRKAKRPLRIDQALGAEAPPAWEGAFAQCMVRGTVLNEVDFFHRPSLTLVLTDLIENFEVDRVCKCWLRVALKLAGAADPDGKAPFDMQLSFIGHRKELRDAVRRMIDWRPERIVIAHGRCYERDGVAELKRAFRWVL